MHFLVPVCPIDERSIEPGDLIQKDWSVCECESQPNRAKQCNDDVVSLLNQTETSGFLGVKPTSDTGSKAQLEKLQNSALSLTL